MKIFKRIKRAFKAFFTEEKPSRAPLEEILDLLQKAEAKKDPVTLYNERLSASEAARKAHMVQNKQIDEYFGKVIEQHINPISLQMFRNSRMPIPGLASNVHFFTNLETTEFGRRITVQFRDKVIGDAIFTAKFQNGVAECRIEEKIKINSNQS